MDRDITRRILIIYYTQSGQIKQIIDKISSSFNPDNNIIEYLEIKPIPAFPFPWSSNQFFDAFPESVNGIACEIEQIKAESQNYDLIIFAYQPWYLAPSIPVHSFFQAKGTSDLLKNKKVITVIACRNMWIMGQERVKKYLKEVNAELIGNIVLSDKNPNLISILTIVKWLIKGKKEKSRLLPAAGVSDSDINASEKFGKIIESALERNELLSLQNKLNNAGAVKVKPFLAFIENNGRRIFSIWASIILKRNNINRRNRILKLFKYYLFAVLFLITPFAFLLFNLICLFFGKKTKRQINYYSNNSLSE